MQGFFIAVQFLTRFPFKFNIDWNEENVAASLLWYPLVGALIGGVLLLLAYMLAYLQASAPDEMLIAAIILSVWVIITGGLHLDGLADSADAWVGSNANKQRALDIMKDPQAGPMAVIALVLLLLVKFSALQSLLKQSEMCLLILPVIIARCVPLLLFLTTPYVREKGLGSAMAKYIPKQAAWIVLLLSVLLLAAIIGVVNGVLLIGITLFVVWVLRYLMIKHIEGMTGDTIGAAVEITETVVLCFLALL